MTIPDDPPVLGRSGIEISEFIFGAGSIGGLGGAVAARGLGIDVDQGLDRLTEAYREGVRVIDTADSYGGGESERAVGRWLAEQPHADVLVHTKVGGGLSGPHIESRLRRSMRRLGRVDLYMSHAPDPATPIEETLHAFAAAVAAGSIRAYGVSNVDARLLESILDVAARHGWPRPEWVQNGYSLLLRVDERDLMPLITAEQLGYMAYSPLAGGVLSDRYLDEASPPPGSRMALVGDLYYAGMHSAGNLARVARLRDLAREHGVSTSGLALAWVSASPAITAPIVSPRTAGQWNAVREATALRFERDLIDRIAAIFD
jgi:aryl-alcohol dehydrogenase-like predicted oxidoreductase